VPKIITKRSVTYWKGKEVSGWHAKAAKAFFYIISMAYAPFAIGVRLITGDWPSWFSFYRAKGPNRTEISLIVGRKTRGKPNA
jgi:hypothetical protein